MGTYILCQASLHAATRHRIVLLGIAQLQLVSGALCQPFEALQVVRRMQPAFHSRRLQQRLGRGRALWSQAAS